MISFQSKVWKPGIANPPQAALLRDFLSAGKKNAILAGTVAIHKSAGRSEHDR
jgi:hypothetical protein